MAPKPILLPLPEAVFLWRRERSEHKARTTTRGHRGNTGQKTQLSSQENWLERGDQQDVGTVPLLAPLVPPHIHPPSPPSTCLADPWPSRSLSLARRGQWGQSWPAGRRDGYPAPGCVQYPRYEATISQPQTHPSSLTFVRVGPGLCNPHFCFAL